MEKLHRFSSCFVCGEKNVNPMSLEIERWWDAEKREVFTEVTPSDSWGGFKGIVHGGIQAALMDEVMAWACRMTSGRFTMTLRMEIFYEKPMKTAETYRVRGGVSSSDDKKIQAWSVIEDSVGRRIARSEGDFYIMSEKRSSLVEEEMAR